MARPPVNPLIKRCTNEAVFLASSMVDRCMEAARAGLEAAEKKSGNVAHRLQMAEAMMALGKHRARLRGDFPARVERAVTGALDALHDAAPAREVRPAGMGADADEGFSLVGDAEVARFVEASKLQQTVLPVVERNLSRLDTLMSSVIGLPVVRADLNPMRPEVMCQALMDGVADMPEDEPIRALWLRHMADAYAQELNSLYDTLAKMLEEQGVQEARYRLKLTEGGALPARPAAAGGAPGGAGAGTGAGAAAAAPAGAALESDAELIKRRRALFPRMEQLAQPTPAVAQGLVHDFLYRPQWLAENDEPLPASYYQAVNQQMAGLARAPAPVFDAAAEQAAHARQRQMSVVDRPAREVGVDAPLAPERWGAAASAQARTQTLMQLKSQAKKISQVLGLDAVRTLVGQVADDARVLAPVREAFVALEPALLKLAMDDPRFFGDDEHPARRLIETVAQRSFKYNDEYSDEFEHFLAPVRAAVRELGAVAKPASADFSARLQSLEQQWQAEDTAEKTSRESGLRSIHFAHDRQALADKIAWEFSLRSDVEGVPVVVADFLYQDWSLVIAHAQLTDTRGQLDPGGYLGVVSDLLWSVKRRAALREPARLFEVIPPMVQTLRRGLDMLGKAPQDTAQFFETLIRYHEPVMRLRRRRSALDAEASGFAPTDLGDSSLQDLLDSDPIPLEKPKPRAAEQPWIGRHELAAAGFQEPDALEQAVQALEHAAADEDDFADTLPSGVAELDDAPLADAPAAPAPAAAPVAVVPPPEALGPPPGHEGRIDFVPLDMAAPPAADEPAAPAAAPAPVAAPAATPAPGGGNAEDRAAETRALLARLREGDWVDLNVDGRWRRAKLEWSSGNGALFMFVSRGGQPHTMTRRSCERLIHSRLLRPVQTGAVVDQALRHLSDARHAAREGAESHQ